MSNPLLEALEALARVVAPILARAVVDELRAGQTGGMLDQSASALGRRRHIAAVRRRVAAGEPGAVVLGRRYLLSPEAHADELATLATRTRKRGRRAELLSNLGLEENPNH